MHVKRDKRMLVAFLAVAVLVLALLGVAGVFAKKYYDLRANPEQVTNAERDQLVEKVSKLYKLPEKEQPIVGEVQDINKLKDQPFFKSAANGDKILIYKEARVAIVYRPNTNKLINVGPIAIDAAPQEGGQPQTTQPATTDQAPTQEQTTQPSTTP